jgi:hypothetical protein
MKQRQPVLRDGREQPRTAEHHIAYHESFLARLERLDPHTRPHYSREAVRSASAHDDLVVILRRLEGALSDEEAQEAEQNASMSSSRLTTADEFSIAPMSPAASSVASPLPAPGLLTTSIHDGTALDPSASLSLRQSPLQQPPPPPPDIAQRLLWYRHYVEWVLYYRACAQHLNTRLAEQRPGKRSIYEVEDLLYQT